MTHFYYNNQWQVVEERVGASTSANQQYVYHSHYVDAVAIRYDVSADKRHYYLQDANFNVTAVVDDTGTVEERYSYTPYGEVTILDLNFSAVLNNVSAISNEHLYTGRRLDPETGLQLNRNRFYAAGLGRWVNRDPLEASFNLYSYGSSMPMNETDPSGLVAKIPNPCGSFKWKKKSLAGRPGWKIDFNPYGCKCPGGKIKLVQVINRGGNSYFDIADPNDDNYDPVDPDTDYPGFCESRDTEHCTKSPFRKDPRDPAPPNGYRDAPQGSSYSVSICAVCQIAPGKETLLGCTSFTMKDDKFSVVPPNVEQPCRPAMGMPSGQPHPEWWDQAEDNWKKTREKRRKRGQY